MSPAQADALRDAIIHCRQTSRDLAIAEGSEVTAAIVADDAANAAVNTMISELTK